MTIKSLTLYHYPLSRSARVKWCLHEILGDAFETVTLDLMRGEGMTPEFLQKNPNHAVPVLDVIYEDGQKQTIIESGAITLWLADTYPEAKLAPAVSDMSARADYLQTVLFGSSTMDMMLWQIRLHRDLLPERLRHPPQIKLYMNKWGNEIEPQLIDRLSRQDFICGDKFTAADCIIGQNVNWSRAYGLSSHPVFKNYYQRLKSRPAFQQAFADAANFEK